MIIKDLIIQNPKLSVVVISFLVTLVMTLVTKKFTNQARMKELKAMQKSCQKKIKDNKGDIQKQQEINKQMMESSMELMKHSFKPLFITMIPLLFIFWWLRGTYAETTIASVWIWWYIGTSIISSMILRKVLNVA